MNVCCLFINSVQKLSDTPSYTWHGFLLGYEINKQVNTTKAAHKQNVDTYRGMCQQAVDA